MKKIVCKLAIVLSVFTLPAYADQKTTEVFFELGTSFGGDEVAENDNGGAGGDDYKAGGGAILGFGLKTGLSGNLQGQGLAAVRYQGGDGSNSGLVLEGAVLYKLNNAITFGAGIHADMTSKTKTAAGNTIKFDNAVGPMLLADWVITSNNSVGAKFIAIDYETDDGDKYEGNQLAVYVQYRF